MAELSVYEYKDDEIDGWIDGFLVCDRQRQRRIAGYHLRVSVEAEECWTGNHADRLENLLAQRRNALAICQEVNETLSRLSPPGGAAAGTLARRVASAFGTALWPA